MEIENLILNKKIHYKDLVDLLKIPQKTGKYRTYQINEIKRFCNLDRYGNGYIITKIYAEPLEKINQYKVYMHKNKINSKVYIGITLQPVNQRWRNGTNYTKNPIFNRAIKKYGWNEFEHIVLFDNLTKEEAEAKEIELIKLYKSTNPNHGYNIENGGNTNGKHSKETLRKMSENQKGGLNHNAKKVICLNNLKIFDSIQEAKNYANCSDRTISNNCYDKNNSAGCDKNGVKLTWMFYDEYDEGNVDYIKYKINKTLNKKKYTKPLKVKSPKKGTFTKPVKCINHNTHFNSEREACDFYNLTMSKLSQCLTGTCNGTYSLIEGSSEFLIFEFISKEEYELNKNINAEKIKNLHITGGNSLKVYNNEKLIGFYPSVEYFCKEIKFLNGVKYDKSKVGYYLRKYNGIHKDIRFEYANPKEYIKWFYKNKLKEIEKCD